MPVYDDYSDEQLTAAARSDDFGAWEAFIRRHGQRLLAFTTRMTGDEEVSRDLWTQTFCELWRRRRAPPRGEKPDSAMFSLAISLCAKAAVPAPRQVPLGDPASLELRSALLRRSLLGLPFRPRTALCLCYFENVSFEEAERCLGAAAGEARQLCAEAYEALARSLGPGFLTGGLS